MCRTDSPTLSELLLQSTAGDSQTPTPSPAAAALPGKLLGCRLPTRPPASCLSKSGFNVLSCARIHPAVEPLVRGTRSQQVSSRPTSGHLEPSGDIFGCHAGEREETTRPLAGRGQKSCRMFWAAEDSPTTRHPGQISGTQTLRKPRAVATGQRKPKP